MLTTPESFAANPLIRKLEHYTRLSAGDQAGALRLCSERLLRACAKDDLVQEGDEPRVVRLVVEG